uniref:tyrosine-type recombinase/integrase n=1 Tax=Xenorhabdus sp. PB30.3 TaxID=2788941 RepID=UPI001E409168
LSKCSEWNLNSMLWTVPKENSKTGEKIIRPIPEYMKPFLMDIIHQNHKSGYLLGEIKKLEAVAQYGRKIWKKLEHDEEWSLHDLRRTFATKLNDIGIAPHVVEQLLGHALPGIMAIYNKSQYLPEKLDALHKWCERLDVLAGNYENVVILKAAQ